MDERIGFYYVQIFSTNLISHVVDALAAPTHFSVDTMEINADH